MPPSTLNGVRSLPGWAPLCTYTDQTVTSTIVDSVWALSLSPNPPDRDSGLPGELANAQAYFCTTVFFPAPWQPVPSGSGLALSPPQSIAAPPPPPHPIAQRPALGGGYYCIQTYTILESVGGISAQFFRLYRSTSRSRLQRFCTSQPTNEGGWLPLKYLGPTLPMEPYHYPSPSTLTLPPSALNGVRSLTGGNPVCTYQSSPGGIFGSLWLLGLVHAQMNVSPASYAGARLADLRGTFCAARFFPPATWKRVN